MISFFSTIPGAIILLLVGFVLLIKGADFFVEGASAVAKKLKVPALIIGMTIVAMGTSLPEASVSMTASLANANQLAIGNVVGSNIFNLMVVLGLCALFSKLEVAPVTVKKDLPFSMLCAAVLAAMCLIGNTVGHIDGIILLVMFAGFIVMMIRTAKKARNAGANIEGEMEILDDNDIVDLATWKCIVYIIGGAVAIKFGGDWVVESCRTIALKCGMSETLVGLTIVALGTSLPELVTSIVAARKNELDMAVGNVVGSNVFNILMVLGIAASISPVEVIAANIMDIAILIVFSTIVLIFCKKKGYLYKAEGASMLVLYVLYLIYIIVRDGGLA